MNTSIDALSALQTIYYWNDSICISIATCLASTAKQQQSKWVVNSWLIQPHGPSGWSNKWKKQKWVPFCTRIHQFTALMHWEDAIQCSIKLKCYLVDSQKKWYDLLNFETKNIVSDASFLMGFCPGLVHQISNVLAALRSLSDTQNCNQIINLIPTFESNSNSSKKMQAKVKRGVAERCRGIECFRGCFYRDG